MARSPAATPRLARPASIEDVLLYRLSRVRATAGTMVIRLCEGRFGITRREWLLLAILANEDGVLSSQLAERAHLDRARTSRAVTSLVAKKLIRRSVGAKDRREARLTLTDSGRTLYAQLFPLVLGINLELQAALTPAQLAALDASLDALQAKAQAMVLQADLPKADRRRGGRLRAGWV